MCKKLTCVVCFILSLCVLAGTAKGDPTTDLLAHYEFGGNANDSSGNNFHGTEKGNPTYVAGMIGQAINLDGDGDYVDCTNNAAFDITDAITVAAWIKVHAFDKQWQYIVGKGDSAWRMVRETTTNNIRWRANGPSPNLIVTGTVNVNDGQWHHLAGTYDGSMAVLYVDGIANASLPCSGAISKNTFSVWIGQCSQQMNRAWNGLIDDVRIYRRALTQDEISSAMKGKPQPYAFRPDPADGALREDIWVSLGWTAGAFAASHDVYLGDNLNDVNAGAGDTFRGNQTANTYLAGFPGLAYPNGLVPGTTYYWRIDEVNNADPNSPWKGDIWSFSVPPRKAYNPIPPDGAKYVATEGATLRWIAGMGAKLHTVYFGDNSDTVNTAVGGGLQAAATYNPGALASDKTYYWRVDEFDGAATYKGDIWSFKTIPTLPVIDVSLLGWWKLDEGQGTSAVDWSGHGNHGKLNGTPQWADGYDGGALDLEYSRTHDGVAVKAFDVPTGAITLAAWVKPESFSQNDGRIITKATGTAENDHFWMLSTVASGGQFVLRFRLKTNDGQNTTTLIATQGTLAVGQWTHAAATWDGTSMVLYKDGVEVGRVAKAGTAVTANATLGISIGNHLAGTTGNRAWDGLIDDVRVYNKALSTAELSQAMRGDVFVAWAPAPARDARVELDKALPLSWSRGDKAVQHDVYFGTSKDAVANADASDTTGVYRGRQSASSYTPPEGVEWGGGPYYWRIDEVNNDGTISPGRIWSFTVADFVLVDDFERYDVGQNQIWWAWKDGLGYAAHDNQPAYPGNGTGSAIGDDTTPSYTEETIVHGGGKSMPFSYDNNQQGKSKYSAGDLALTSVRDWTADGVAELSLWFRGDAANAAERMYVALNGTATVYHDNPNVTQTTAWTEWVIPLQTFAGQGVNLANVTSITIGIGTKGNTTPPGGAGKMYFDDIRLYRPATP